MHQQWQIVTEIPTEALPVEVPVSIYVPAFEKQSIILTHKGG